MPSTGWICPSHHHKAISLPASRYANQSWASVNQWIKIANNHGYWWRLVDIHCKSNYFSSRIRHWDTRSWHHHQRCPCRICIPPSRCKAGVECKVIGRVFVDLIYGGCFFQMMDIDAYLESYTNTIESKKSESMSWPLTHWNLMTQRNWVFNR